MTILRGKRGPYNKKPLVDRFLSKVKINENSGCWEWLGRITDDGYGIFSINSKPVRAHRFSYSYFKDDLGANTAHHLCRNRRCVNPEHLGSCSNEENARDGQIRNSFNREKKCCKHGHLFDEQNTYIRTDGTGRSCLKCQQRRNRGRLRNVAGRK